MAEATNTILGEIKLTGDLAGDGGAQVGSNPQLKTMPGLTAGQYNVANITVDTKGRITDIEGASSAQIAALIPDATNTVKGKVSIGSNIQTSSGATSGYQMVNFGGVLLTTTLLDHCESATYPLVLMVDGTTIEYSFAGSDLGTDVEDMLAYINANVSGFTVTLDSGNLKVESDEVGSPSTIDITGDGIFSCMSSFVSLGTPVDGLSACEIYVNDATTTVAGVVQIGSGVSIDNGEISVAVGVIPTATTTTLGGVIVPTAGNIDIDGSGNISVPVATTSSVGVVSVGSGLTVNGSGVLSYSTGALPVASDTILGCVKEGSGVTIAGDGTLSVNISSLAKASESTVGIMQVGNGLDVDVNGVVSVDLSELTIPTASDTVLGGIKIGNGLDIDGNGVVSVDPTEILASGASAGCVSVGSNITLSAGQISVVDSSTSVKGVVQIQSGTGLSVSSGVLSGIDATTSNKGVVQVGASGGLTIASGVLNGVDATTSTHGVVQIGSNINVSGGVISIPNATTSNKGVVQVGTNIDVTNGVISVADSSTSNKGVVQVGSNLLVSSGVISADINYASTTVKGILSIQTGTGLSISSGVLSGADATTSTKGVVQVGSNINVTSGTISVPTAADTTTFGVVKSASASNISISSGLINVGSNIPKLDTQNKFTQAQVSTISSTSYTASWTPSFSASNIFTMTLTGNLTINNPTNVTAGTTVVIVLQQDSTGLRSVSFGSNFKFPTDETSSISGVANSYSVITIQCLSSTSLLTSISRGFL